MVVPVPSLNRLPVPLTMPPKVPVFVWSNVTLALSVMLPCKLVVLPVSEPTETVVPPLNSCWRRKR